MKHINAIIFASFAVMSSSQAADSQEKKQKQRIDQILEKYSFERMSTASLNFYLGHDRLDGHIFGLGMCNNARDFTVKTQAKIADQIKSSSNFATLKADLNGINPHAEALCRTCAMLEVKQRNGQQLGTLPAETTFYLFSPRTTVDAEKFYKNGCGELYKNLSSNQLEQVLDATKPAVTKKFAW